MIFSELYDDKLDIELGSEDLTQLFTTVRRKAAVNEAQDDFARQTGCTKLYGSIPIVDETAEYDIEATLTDYIRRAGPPSVKIVTSTETRYIQGKRDFPRHDPEELDLLRSGWRSADPGTPNCWYIREDGGQTILGLNPPPKKVTASDTWSLIVPYVADPADMVNDADVPFTFSANPIRRLYPFHQALVHFAAGRLELLRKNRTGSETQMNWYTYYVAQYLRQERQEGPDQIMLLRNYLGERRTSRAPDPHRWP